jgi:hypothetical protein
MATPRRRLFRHEVVSVLTLHREIPFEDWTHIQEMPLDNEMSGTDLTFSSSVVAPTPMIRRITVAGH